MWDLARSSATGGLDRLHRPSRRRLKDGPSTDKHAETSIFRQNDVDNALGIAIVTPQRPKRPPRPDQIDCPSILRVAWPAAAYASSGITPTDDRADYAEPPSPIDFEPPPRNPRRLLRQYAKDSAAVTAYYPEPQIVTDSESTSASDGDGYSSSPASTFKLASTYSRRRPPALDQISPPSSPETGAFKYDAPVSPIDEDDGDFHREYPFRGSQQPQPYVAQRQVTTSIPVPVQQYSAYRPGAEMQDSSFENPRSLEDVPMPQGALQRANKMRLHLTSDGSVGQRFRFLTKGKAEPTETLSDRPMQQQVGSAVPPPLNIPRRSSKRISRAHHGPRNISAPLPPIQSSSELETPPRQQPVADRDHLPSTVLQRPTNATTPVSKLTPHITIDTHALPTPPNSDYPAPLFTQSARAHSPAGPDMTPTGPRIIKRKPAQNHSVQPLAPSNLSSSSPAYMTPPPPRRASAAASTGLYEGTGLYEAAAAKSASTEEAWTQPPSRFSVTTYATSNTGTPRQVSEERMPTVTESGAAPVVSRPGPFARRDIATVPSASHTITIPKQRAYMSSPYGADHQTAASSDASLSGPAAHGRASSNAESTRRSSILSTTKPLPPAPPELASSDDRIAQLNAILAGLAHRKVNINKSIQQMTELMPRDHLMANEEVLRKREIEKQKVEGLKQELAEIQHEEYDLGLKLHRAYKRLDKEAEFEPTTLWVRRITTS